MMPPQSLVYPSFLPFFPTPSFLTHTPADAVVLDLPFFDVVVLDLPCGSS